jgi:tetratricopeptide (TPR) repeat protein
MLTLAGEHLRQLTDHDRNRLETVVERFEAAWERGEQPSVDDYLPADGDLRPAAVIELALADLEYRRRAGEPARADDYLDRYPEVRDTVGAETELRAAEERWLKSPRVILRGLNEHSIPGYELIGELGRGGMGVVYKARQIAADRVVALKMIRTDGPPDADLAARFRTEAEAAAQLQHPHIVQIFEVGAHRGRPFFAMEFVEGGTLADRLSAGPLPPADAAALLLPLARAVAAAHARGVLHRDLKPANVLLAEEAMSGEKAAGDPTTLPPHQLTNPKIADFGLAKRLDRASDQTRTGAVVGTPSFMAPEQAAGPSRELTPAADIYALGATLYACLTGRPPFQAATVLETIEQVRTREPAPPRLLQPGVPRDLETICLKCLRKEPSQRYASATDLADDLERYRVGRPIVARPIGRAARAMRWCRRNPVVAGLAAALAVLVPAALVTVSVLYVRAERERVAAAAAAQRADEKSELARATVDGLLSALGSRLRNTQDIPKVRRDMYEQALALYRRFADERDGATPEVRRGIGRLLGRLGGADRDLGRLPEAREQMQQSEALLRELVAERPDDAAVRQTLGETLEQRAQLLRMTGNTAGAAAAFREAANLYDSNSASLGPCLNSLAVMLNDSGQSEAALAVLKELVDKKRKSLAANLPDPAAATGLGLYLTNLAISQQQLGRLPEAAESLHETVSIYEKAAAADPKNQSRREYLANAAITYSVVLAGLHQYDEAVSAGRRAIEVLTRLAADFPDLPRHRHRLAQAHSNVGTILVHTIRPAEGDRETLAALEILERLVADYPAVSDYRAQLSSVVGTRAQLLSLSGKRADALPLFDRAVALVEGQTAMLRHPDSRRNLARLYHGRAKTLVLLGRLDDAVRDWDKAMPLAAAQDRAEFENERAKSIAAGAKSSP